MPEDELQVYKDELRLANDEIERLRAALREVEMYAHRGLVVRIARRALDGEGTDD